MIPNPYLSKHPSAKALQDSIEHLYSVFFEYHNHPLDKGSPISVTEAMRKPLETKQLQELSKDDLISFAIKALTTWGSVDDFRHFLPRILELNISNGLYWTSSGSGLFEKLIYGKWRTWPQEEQDAIEQYCQALWRYILDVVPNPEPYGACPTNRLLEALDQIVDIQPYLAQWGDTVNETIHLANIVTYHTMIYRESGIVYHVAWEPWGQSIRPTIRKWLVQEAHLERLEQAFFQKPESELLSDAVDALFWLIKHRD